MRYSVTLDFSLKSAVFARLIEAAGVKPIKFHGLRAYLRDVVARGVCAAKGGAGAARPSEDRNDARRVRARVAVDAARRGANAGRHPAPTVDVAWLANG